MAAPNVCPTKWAHVATSNVTELEEALALLAAESAPFCADPVLAERLYDSLGRRPPVVVTGWLWEAAEKEAESAEVAVDGVVWAALVIVGEKLDLYSDGDDSQRPVLIAGSPERVAATLAAAEFVAVKALGSGIGPQLGVSPAVALDAFFSGMDMLPPADRERILWEIRGAESTSFSDQCDSASSAALLNASRIFGGDFLPKPARSSDVPDWARLSVFDVITRWLAGTVEKCAHEPDPHRPQPVVAAAWLPGLITCAACTHLLCRVSEETDKTCDGCGHVCLGLEVDDGIYPTSIIVGCLTFVAGLCKHCYADWPAG